MSNCGKISASILLDCDNPLVGGAKDRLILINKDDIASVTRNVTNPQIIEAITLVTTSPATVAFQIEGKNYSNDVSWEFVKARYSENYNHEVVFRIFDNGPDVKKQIEAMGKGTLVAIIENNFRGNSGDAAFEILGLDVGLKLTEGNSNKSDAETQGAPVLTLRTPDDYKEPHLPATLFITDYTTSKAVVDGLLAA